MIEKGRQKGGKTNRDNNSQRQRHMQYIYSTDPATLSSRMNCASTIESPLSKDRISNTADCCVNVWRDRERDEEERGKKIRLNDRIIEIPSIIIMMMSVVVG